jgi:hypothetical protein
MSIVELLRTKSGEYELPAEWHAERALLDDAHLRSVPGDGRGRDRPEGRSPTPWTWSRGMRDEGAATCSNGGAITFGSMSEGKAY